MADQTIGVHCEAVARLPPKCRRVYLMRKVHGMSHKEIAQHMGITTTTVERHITKGIRDCARYMEEQLGDANSEKTPQDKVNTGSRFGGKRNG